MSKEIAEKQPRIVWSYAQFRQFERQTGGGCRLSGVWVNGPLDQPAEVEAREDELDRLYKEVMAAQCKNFMKSWEAANVPYQPESAG